MVEMSSNYFKKEEVVMNSEDVTDKLKLLPQSAMKN